jgi:Lrp/AsnC family transcriptional regulator, regulator for asnA, asnC and gidA
MQTDEVDESIMALLRDDGRLSNREVARRLDVSEGTVRQRLKKLEDANAIRMGVVVDPVNLGVGFAATVLLTVEPRRVEEVLDAFCKLPEAAYVATIMGSFNIFVSITTVDMPTLRGLIDAQLGRCGGVERLEIRPMISTPKHDYHLIAIPPKR